MRRFTTGATLLGILAFALPAVAGQAIGAVYTATNNATANAVVAFDRDANGTLSLLGSFPTGGKGTGTGLGNQGGIRLTRDGRFVIVVNAGTNDLSVLEVEDTGLIWRDRVSSGGLRPVSVAINGRLVYALNAGGAAGGADSLVGFRLSRDGKLTMIPGSARSLSGTSTGPAQVEFSSDGSVLVVTEKATNKIDVFDVDVNGTNAAGRAYASAGLTPFGFAIGHRDQFYVSEAFGGAPNGSAASSYQITRNGQVRSITPSAATTETAACWVVVTNNGRYLYTTNAGSGTISGFRISADGTIALLTADGVTALAGPGPSDMALSHEGRFLYALHSGIGAISGFGVDEEGGLAAIGQAHLPAGANGLAGR
jgi:6-phosphogluconolactonase